VLRARLALMALGAVIAGAVMGADIANWSVTF
jgi:hypothetical protein